jgi:hypothetical protein
METATDVQDMRPVRVCKRPGCTTELGPKNRIGLCRRHVRWTGAGEVRSSIGNEHAASRSNGHDRTAGNGRAAANGEAKIAETTPDPARDLVASRLDHLFASLTTADKAQIADAWLRGEI